MSSSTTNPELPVLELTQEMSLPPDFEATRLNVWCAEQGRDLVAEVRNDLRNGLDNGRDMLAENPSDGDIAGDLHDCIDGYEHIPFEVLRDAITLIRKTGGVNPRG
jgi:hypothetical protein